MDWNLRVHSLRRAPTQTLPYLAYGRPLLDCCMSGNLFSGARIPFFAATLLDGVELVPDEYAVVNYVCYNGPFEACQHEGAAENISFLAFLLTMVSLAVALAYLALLRHV